MKKEEKNMKVSISSFHGVKVSAELPWDATTTQVMEAIQGMMISLGYSNKWLKLFCHEYLEENGGIDNE